MIYLASGLILIDQIIKLIVVEYLVEPIKIIDGFFSLHYVKNFGVSFSMLNGNPLLILAISACAIGFLVYLLKQFYFDKYLRVGLVVMLAGAFGNLVDRVTLGYVVDYLDFNIFGWDFAIFNFADMLLVCGAIYVAIVVMIQELRK